jgi:hypothetical protein
MSDTATFTTAAQLLGAVAGRYGLVAPGFRSPPRVVGVQRTIRRRQGGGVVAVALKDRPLAGVLADMIEGIVVLNDLSLIESCTLRTALWEEVEQLLQPAPAPAAFSRAILAPERVA